MDKNKIIQKDIITLKLRDIKEQIYNEKISFKSPSIKDKDAEIISIYGINNKNKFSINAQINKIIICFIWYDLFFTFEKSEGSIVTIEIITKYKNPIIKFLTDISYSLSFGFKDKEYQLDLAKMTKIYIETSNEFCFNNYYNSYTKKNSLKIISPQKLEFYGNGFDINNFIFILNNYKISKDEQKFFYCYNQEEITKIEESINKIKFKFDYHILCIKDIFNINNKQVYAKSFINFINFQPFLKFYNLNFYMENFKDLKILKWKCNHDNNGNNGYRKVYEPIIKDDYIEFQYYGNEKENFYTIEFEYSFSLLLNNEYDSFKIVHNKMGENFYYKLLINYIPSEYKNFNFENIKSYTVDKNEIKIETFYQDSSKTSYYPSYYDALYLYK